MTVRKKWFPIEGTQFAPCWVCVRCWSHYASITFDLWRSPCSLSQKGKEALETYYCGYLDEWVKKAKQKEEPFPRKGIVFGTGTCIDWTIRKKDLEEVTVNLWGMLTTPANTESIRLGGD